MRNSEMFGKKKILYITYDGLTDPLGRSQIIPYLVGISFAGYEVTVLSCEKKALYKSKKETVKKILRLSNITWKKKFYTKRPAVLSTLWDIYWMRHKASSLHSKKNFNIVHCRTVLSALIGKKLQDDYTKLVFDIRGFWADERVEGGLWDLNKKTYRKIFNFFKNMESRLFEESDHIIALTQKAKMLILDKHPSLNEKDISVIPCAVELMVFNPVNIKSEAIEEKKKLLGISPTDFVLGYIGSFGTRYLAIEMLAFFAELKKTIPQSKFIIVSNGGDEIVHEYAKELNIEHTIVSYKADYSEMPLMISLFNAAIYFIKTGFSGVAVSPTKQAEILAMGKPIVSNMGIGDSDEILSGSNSGVLLSDFSDASMQNAVKELNILLKKKPEEIRKVAEKRFSVEKAVENYVAAYRQLL